MQREAAIKGQGGYTLWPFYFAALMVAGEGSGVNGKKRLTYGQCGCAALPTQGRDALLAATFRDGYALSEANTSIEETHLHKYDTMYFT